MKKNTMIVFYLIVSAASAFPFAVQREAVIKRGALGLVSYHSNSFFGVEPAQDVVSWGGVRATTEEGKPAGFGFMLAPSVGKRLHERLHNGEKLTVRASVKVKNTSPGKLELVTAEWPGTGSANDDVVFSAHLDHQQPGANDNASGSAALLEIARTLKQLVEDGAIAPPQRTLRFWWVTEISGTFQYFFHHPEEAQRIAFNINIDQAGGDKHYRNDLVFIRSPRWLPNFVNDAFDALCEYAQTNYAEAYHAPSQLFIAPTGRSDEPFTYHGWQYAPLTDHIVFEDAAVNIPSLSLAYPSFHYIHTSADGLEHIDTSTLKRTIFFATVMGLYLASPANNNPFTFEVAARIHSQAVGSWSRALALIAASTKE